MEWARTRPGGAVPQPTEWSARVQALVAVAAGVVGLTAYVYVLGGVVLWLRMTAARLPTEQATNAFQDRQLLATGLKALGFELILLLVLTLVVWGAWRLARSIGRRVEASRQERATADDRPRQAERESSDEELEEDVVSTVLRALAGAVISTSISAAFDASARVQWVAFLLIALAGFLLGVLLIFRVSPEWLRQMKEKAWVPTILQVLRWGVTLGVLLFAVYFMAAPLGLTVIVFLVLVQFSERLVQLTTVERMRDLVIPVLILAAALNLVIVPYLATPPVTFDRAAVALAEKKTLEGALIGRADDRLFLATCEAAAKTESKAARVRVIPADQVRQVVLGGTRYSFDDGERPSLWNMMVYLVEQDSIGATSRLELDLRDGRPVCGHGP